MINSLLSTTSFVPVSRAQLPSSQAPVEQISESLSREEAVIVSLSDEARALIEGQQSNARPTGDDIFTLLDADADGLVSRDEFVSGRPDFASEEQADALFSRIDTQGDGFVTQQEIEAVSPEDAPAAAVAGNRPPPPPPPPPPVEEEEYDELDTNEDGIVSFDELLGDDEDEESSGANGALPSQLFADATRAYSNAFDLQTRFTDSVSV